LSFATALPSTAGGSGDSKKERGLAKEFLQAALRKELNQNIEYTAYQETGEVGSVVKRLVEQHQVDLVVINRGHLQHPFGKLRTHAFEIVLESPCPVISLCISAAERPEVNSDHELETAYHSS
jgi:predicted Fe-Mo cluster-binding NifX family protein